MSAECHVASLRSCFEDLLPNIKVASVVAAAGAGKKSYVRTSGASDGERAPASLTPDSRSLGISRDRLDLSSTCYPEGSVRRPRAAELLRDGFCLHVGSLLARGSVRAEIGSVGGADRSNGPEKPEKDQARKVSLSGERSDSHAAASPAGHLGHSPGILAGLVDCSEQT